MDVQVAEKGPCRRTLKITLAPEDIQANVDAVYRSAAEQVEVKGFRKGKVPRKVLKQRFGDEIEVKAKERIVGSTLDKAITDSGLDVIGKPEIEGFDFNADIDPSSELAFEVHVDIQPVFELGDVTGIEVEGRDASVTDADIDNALQEIASQKRTLDTVDEPIQDGDFFKVDLTYKDEAGEVVGHKEGQQLNTGIPLAGTDPQLFADKMRGQEPGAKTTIELTFPDTFDNEAVRNQEGTVEIEIKEVLRVQPAPIDDELAKGYDFESLDDLKKTLRERIAHEKAQGEKARREDAILEKIRKAHPFDLPRSMVEQETASLLQDLERRMKEGGLDEEQIQGKLAEERPNAEKLAEERVHGYFLVDAIARKENIFVTEGDVETEIRKVAAEHNVEPNVVREHFEQQQQMDQLRMGVRERKVREFLTSKAKIVDSTGDTES